MSANDLQLHSGSPQKRKRRELDFYPTPPECTHALMQFLKLEPCRIWECASGNGAMAEVIKSYNHKVISTDIQMGQNYLTTQIEADAIITNPPFNLSEAFIRKAVGETKVVAMLLKSQYWHAKKRLKLYQDFTPSFILPLTWRPDFLYQTRSENEKSSPTMEVSWSVWVSGNTDAKYIPLQKPKAELLSLF